VATSQTGVTRLRTGVYSVYVQFYVFDNWQVFCRRWDNVGFPIAEIDSDGTIVISKPPNTGGLVSIGTVAEQLVYEIHDAANYILPDVVVDFTQLKLEQVGK